MESKDIVLAILGASGAMAGLLLVFAGFIFTQAASFPSTTPDEIINKYRLAGRLALVPFWGFLITTLLSLYWLLYGHPERIFEACIWVFAGLVVGTGIYATVVSFRYL